MGSKIASWSIENTRLLRRARTGYGCVDLVCTRVNSMGKWLGWEVHAYWKGTYGVSLYTAETSARDEFYRVLAVLLSREGISKPEMLWLRPGAIKARQTLEQRKLVDVY